MIAWIAKFFLALDIFLATLLPGGIYGQTLSARTGLAVHRGRRWGLVVAPCIDLVFGRGHCEGAIIHDVLRARAILDETTRFLQ